MRTILLLRSTRILHPFSPPGAVLSASRQPVQRWARRSLRHTRPLNSFHGTVCSIAVTSVNKRSRVAGPGWYNPGYGDFPENPRPLLFIPLVVPILLFKGDKFMKIRLLAIFVAALLLSVATDTYAQGRGRGGGGGRPATAGPPSGSGVDRGLGNASVRSGGRSDDGLGNASTRSNGRSDAGLDRARLARMN